MCGQQFTQILSLYLVSLPLNRLWLISFGYLDEILNVLSFVKAFSLCRNRLSLKKARF